MTTAPWVLARRVVALCSASDRMFAARACTRLSRALAVRHRFEPSILRDSARLAVRRSAGAERSALGFETFSITLGPTFHAIRPAHRNLCHSPAMMTG